LVAKQATIYILYVYRDVNIKVVLGRFAVLRLTYTEMTKARSLENNASKTRSRTIYASFHNTI